MIFGGLLSHEVLDTGISVAQLLLALLGIGGGGAVAGHTSAVARIRAEKRLELLDAIDSQSFRPPILGAELLGGDIEPDRWNSFWEGNVVEIGNYQHRLAKIERIVNLLRWDDQARWLDLVGPIKQRLSSAADAAFQAGQSIESLTADGKERFATELALFREDSLALVLPDAPAAPASPYPAKFKALESHLVRSLRPGWAARARRVQHTPAALSAYWRTRSYR